jgi:hypothetical protein
MSRRMLGFALLLIAIVACATRAPTAQAPTDRLYGPTIGNSPGPTGGSLAGIHSRVIGDWTAPFGGEGLLQSSIEAAQSLVGSFTLYDPKKLGDAQIFVAPGRGPGDEAVMFVYQNPTYGPVWVAETLPDGNEKELLAAYEAQVATNGDPDSHVTFEMVSIRSGESALLQYSEDPTVIPTRLEWTENGVYVQVLGPNLTRDDILKIGEGL